MQCQDHRQRVHHLMGWRDRFQLVRLLAVQGRVACRVSIHRPGLELHRSRWLRGTAGQLISMAGIRRLQKLKETVLGADLDLDLVEEPLWALVGRSMLERKAG